MKTLVLLLSLFAVAGLPAVAAAKGQSGQAPAVPTPTDVKPVSITCLKEGLSLRPA